MIISKILQRKRFLACAALTVLLIFMLNLVGKEHRSDMVYAPHYEGDAGNNAVSICINVDWGEDYIADMLGTLEKYDAKATFFLTGRWTEKFPEKANEIKNAKMEIGNHGLRHNSPNSMSYEENLNDIRAAEEIINETLGIKTVLFAPASGEIDKQVTRAAEDAGYQTILWSLDTIDWQKPDETTIISRVLDRVKDGDIILMHPTEHTAAALGDILIGLKENQLTPIFVSDLIK
ncbi:MAG: polysaccharide deacetylase family protein [Firmicutes bacterium]|nr:polysaccharide deacetylase family protein [Bacillota bacterium]